jgi:hypothetical protein
VIPVGILASAHVSATAGALVRQKVRDTAATASSATLTFDEGTALDSSHLLIAIITCASNWTNPGGWTQVAAGTYGILQQRILTKQGDGSTNSITVTQTSNTLLNMTLLAYSGYVTTAASATGGGTNNTNTGGNVTLAGPSTTPALAHGVSILAIAALGNMGVTRVMGNGYTEVAVPTSARDSLIGAKDYNGVGTYSSLVDWGGSVSYFRWLAVVIQLL